MRLACQLPLSQLSVRELGLILRAKAEFAEVAITKEITTCSVQNEVIPSGTQEHVNIVRPHKMVLTGSLLHGNSTVNLVELRGGKKKDNIAVTHCQQYKHLPK